jgi:hypothetical protein
MAEQGESYRDILRYYYTDVAVRPLDEVQSDPQAAPVARRPDAPATDERRIGW